MLRYLASLVLMLLFLGPMVAQAQLPWPNGPQEPQPWVRQAPQEEAEPAPRLSLDEAVALVRERTGGRVVRAEQRNDQQRVYYEVRVLTGDGRVRTYLVDAVTGAMR